MSNLHRDAVVLDCHNDLPIMLLDWYRSVGDDRYFSTTWLPAAKRGGVNVQVIPIYIDPKEAEASLRRALLLIEYLRVEIEKSRDEVTLCLSGAEIDAALGSNKIAIVIALEGCAPIGENVELLRTFYRQGVRIASLTHFGRTLVADGSGEDPAGSRLSSTGIAAVREMERLGMLVDVSHLSAAGVEHVLELISRPVIASHSSARALCDHHRNLTDDQLRAIAATGGVIGVNVFYAFIDPERPTLERVVDHIEHIAEVAGIDHVGLGPDFIKEYFDTVYPALPRFEMIGVDLKVAIENLEGTEDLPNLTKALLGRRFSEADVKKVLGENFMRVFRSTL